MAGLRALPDSMPTQVLTCVIGGECYGIDLRYVRGIDTPPQLTRVPGTPPVIQGVYLRQGALMVAVDPRVLLGLPQQQVDEPHYLVVAAGDLEAALLIDAVLEVIDLAPELVHDLPAALGDSRIVTGRAAIESGAVLILDIPALLDAIVRTHDESGHHAGLVPEP